MTWRSRPAAPPEVTKDALGRMSRLLEDHLGLKLQDAQLETLADSMQKRTRDLRAATVDKYVESLTTAGPTVLQRELRYFAERVTVGESYFFRHGEQLDAFAGAVLQELAQQRADHRRLRILSAGCSRGEEPYTLAILVLENLLAFRSWNVDIVGADVNPRALDQARRGLYSPWSLRDTPEAVRRDYFRSVDGAYLLADFIRRMVRFEEANLLSDGPPWIEAPFDVVFCRNVLIHLVPEAVHQLVSRLESAVAPGGFLFLGPSETLRGLSRCFELLHGRDAFYYRRIPDREPGYQPASPTRALARTASAGAMRSAARATPTRPTAPRPREPARGSPVISKVVQALPGPLARVRNLFRQERFGEALEVLGALRSGHGRGEAQDDPDALLLEAGALAHAGRISEAEDTARQVLSADDQSPSAHYLLGLCREQAGDPDAARTQHEIAIYLDPAFALAHLHLGMLARRGGDFQTARRELKSALDLLPMEDASRILLFGGGFGRRALEQLCRSELAEAGGLA